MNFHPLRKLLLFDFAKKLGLDTCYRCKKRIKRIEDFTIDHKKPWRNNPKKLFAKVSNIAFSHSKCNSSAAYRSGNKRLGDLNQNNQIVKNSPFGKSWCGGCKKYRPVARFHRNKRNPSGLACYCISCRKKRSF